MTISPGYSRRKFLATAGGGAGMLALQMLSSDEQTWAAESGIRNPLAAKKPHFAARAKRVIWLFMHGGPSHVDLFDPKPELVKYSGKPLPDSFGSVMTRRDVARNPALGADQAFSAARRLGSRSQRLLAAHCRTGRRAVCNSQPARRQREPSAIGLPDEHRHNPDGQAQLSAVGWPTDWGPKIKTCRPSSCCPIPAVASKEVRLHGETPSCPRPIKG